MERRNKAHVVSPVPQGTGPRVALPRTDSALASEWNRRHSLRMLPPAWASHCPVPWELAFAAADRPWIVVALDDPAVDAHDDLVARWSADRECRHMNLPEDGCPHGCFAPPGPADSPTGGTSATIGAPPPPPEDRHEPKGG